MADSQDPVNIPVRQLYLWRHAKAKHDHFADFKRPLTRRGQHDAKLIARWMVKQGIQPARVLCSPACRATETWEILRQRLPGEPSLALPETLYNASASMLLRQIHSTPDSVGSLLIVGHNPGLEQLAIDLSGPDSDKEKLVELGMKFSTGALAVLEMAIASWKGLQEGGARLTGFVRPKERR